MKPAFGLNLWGGGLFAEGCPRANGLWDTPKRTRVSASDSQDPSKCSRVSASHSQDPSKCSGVNAPDSQDPSK